MTLDQLKKAVKEAHAKDPWRQVDDSCCAVSHTDFTKAMVRYQPKKRWDPVSKTMVEDTVEIAKGEEKDEVDKMTHLTPPVDPIQPTRRKPAIKETYRLVDDTDVILMRHGNNLGYVVDEYGRAELKRLSPTFGPSLGPDSGLGVVCD